MDQETPLEEVFIFFDTATFDEIERDVKVNTMLWLNLTNLLLKTIMMYTKLCTETQKDHFCIFPEFYSKVTMVAQLGLIGGTMGLLTGFSILSGVEIFYYLLRL